MRIAHVASEIVPFAKTGGLADVAAALPRALADRGHEVVAVTPLHRRDIFADVPGKPAGEPLTVGTFSFGVRRSESGGVTHLLLDAPRLFARPGPYGTGDGDYPDNAIRFAAFGRAAVAAVAREMPQIDLLHLHDWQSAIVAVLLGRDPLLGPMLRDVPTILTIHNLAYQGMFDPWSLDAAALSHDLFHPELLEFFGRVNFLKGGLLAADRLTTVSPTYAREVLEPEHGHGLHEVLRARGDDLTGILNGIDTEAWNPQTDSALPKPYRSETVSDGKAAARRAVAEAAGLESSDAPLLGMVSRLVHQKGVDVVADAVDGLVADGTQLIVLGSGEPELEAELRRCAERHPGRAAVVTGYDEKLARRIYAGADVFLMPSRFEPCGLSQMISMRYGTLPLVAPTGGLADTVRDLDEDPERGNGYRLDEVTAAGLRSAVHRASAAVLDAGRIERLRRRVMAEDHGWSAPAEAYEALYIGLLAQRRP